MEQQTKVTNLSKNRPVSEHDWTIHSLNIQGIFFERWCQETIKNQSSWKVISTNYPVEFPPHNGPLIGEQSALDIWAQIKKTTILLTLLIECKKNNPDFVNWVFFPNQKFINQMAHFSGQLIANQPDDISQFSWETEISLSPIISLEWIATSDAWETRGSYRNYDQEKKKKSEKTRTSNKAITEAAHQIALATRAITNEEIIKNDVLRAKNSGVKMPYQHQIFIPVIITTANLFLCKFDPKDVSPHAGEISYKKAVLEKHPYLLYEYPLPVHFQVSPFDKISFLKGEKRDTLSRMDILIVHSSNFPEFLSKLSMGNA